MRKIVDMTGWKMWEHGVSDSRLTVLKRAGKSNDGHITWLCECSCDQHNQITAIGKDIRSGNTKSCGCLHKEIAKEHALKNQPKAAICASISNKKYNQYDLSGEYGIGWTSNTNKEFYFDIEDYDKIKDYCWYEFDNKKGYCSLCAKDANTKKVIRLHRLLGFKFCDHADRNPLNNRKENLRPASLVENARNHNKQKNNTSGFIGVFWNKNQSRWQSKVYINKKEIHLGSFVKKEDAIKARLEAEAKYYGEFAPQRHLFDCYGINKGSGIN